MKHLTKIIMIAGVVALLGGGCGKTQPTNSANTNRAIDGATRARPVSGEMIVTMDPQTGEFIPVTSFIKVGTKVTFKNTTDKPHNIASNPHPAHTDLPGFDSKTDIAPGASYSYTFDKVGRFLFHDHLNPAFGGAVEVIE